MEENELEHYDRIKAMMDKMLSDLRKSREMHDNLKHKIDMARTDAGAELIREVAWFPEKSGESLPGYHGLHVNNGAREMCINVCPLVLHCRAYAIKHHEIFGIWGGTTLLDRKTIWSQQAKNESKSRKGIPNRRH